MAHMKATIWRPGGSAGPDLIGRERHEPPRTTTGWFTVPKFGAAGSGGLEYELLPEAHTPRDDEHR